MDAQSFLAIWGSVISTVLACIKIFEAWRDRRRLTTSYVFSSPDYGGHQIIIENPTNTSVMINYWELLWLKRYVFWMKTVDGRFPDEGYCKITIKAHDRYVLLFEGKQYFRVGTSTIKKGKLYLKLYIVGQNKPSYYKVYDPNKRSWLSRKLKRK